MAFRATIGGEDFDIEPVPPHTEAQVKKLIEDGSVILEHYPDRVVRVRRTDDPVATYKRP